MSELIDALKANPRARPSEVPYQNWQGFAPLAAKGVVLHESDSFLSQVLSKMVELEIIGEGCNWYPYDDGYDEGPGEIKDSWRNGYYCSTGQWSGYVSEVPAVDALHAELLRAAQGVYEGIPKFSLFEQNVDPANMISNLSDWNGPRSMAERDAAGIEQIKDLYGSLSTDGQKNVRLFVNGER